MAGVTLSDALASLPGLYSTYDRQYHFLGARGLSLPGDFNSRVLVTINGNRINDATYDQGPTGRDFPLDINMIERIEFIPGPGSAVYGQNAMLGVINIITRSGSGANGVELSTSYQIPDTRYQNRPYRNVLPGGRSLIMISMRFYHFLVCSRVARTVSLILAIAVFLV